MKKRVKNKLKPVNHITKTPIGIRILSILGYIISILLLVIGILSLIVSIGLSLNPGPIILPPDFPPEYVDLFTNYPVAILLAFGFSFIIIGIVGILVSRGLSKGRNWARILMIIFSIFGAISNLISLVMGEYSSIVSLLINGLIAWYLLANKEVQKYFGE